MNACSQSHGGRHGERGVTMVLVALAMVAMIAMAALSIDVVMLYLAREEAQRSADAAALAAARVISLSGMTGDPSNISGLWSAICGRVGLPLRRRRRSLRRVRWGMLYQRPSM